MLEICTHPAVEDSDCGNIFQAKNRNCSDIVWKIRIIFRSELQVPLAALSTPPTIVQIIQSGRNVAHLLRDDFMRDDFKCERTYLPPHTHHMHSEA